MAIKRKTPVNVLCMFVWLSAIGERVIGKHCETEKPAAEDWQQSLFNKERVGHNYLSATGIKNTISTVTSLTRQAWIVNSGWDPSFTGAVGQSGLLFSERAFF